MDALTFCYLLAQMNVQERKVETDLLLADKAIENRGWSRAPGFDLVNGWTRLLSERGVKVRKIYLSNGDLTALLGDLALLRGFPLGVLAISDSPISDLSTLKRMSTKKFDRLTLSRTKVSDLSPLKGMKLHFLEFRETPVSDLSSISEQPLEEIRAGGTRVRDLVSLANCKRLKILELSGTPVEDLTPLQNSNVAEFDAKKKQ